MTISTNWNVKLVQERLLPSHFLEDHESESESRDFVSKSEIEETTERINEQNRLKEKLISSASFLSSEGRLPQNLGSYKLQIPYFKLHYGNSLVFMDEEVMNEKVYVSNLWTSYTYVPDFGIIHFSYKGFRISVDWIEPKSDNIGDLPFINACMQIDLDHINTSELAVNRNKIGIKHEAGEIITAFLADEYRRILLENEQMFANEYSILNKDFVNIDSKNGKWLFYDFDRFPHQTVQHFKLNRLPNPPLIFRQIKFPMCIVRNEVDDLFNCYYKGELLNVTPRYFYPLHDVELKGIESNSCTFQLGILKGKYLYSYDNKEYYYSLFPIIEKEINLTAREGIEGFGGFIELPPNLDDILFFIETDTIELSDHALININCKIFKYYNSNSFLKLRNEFLTIDDSTTLTLADNLSYLIYGIKNHPGRKWDTLIEHRSSLIDKVFKNLEISEVKIMSGNASVARVTSKEWIAPSESLPDGQQILILDQLDESYFIKNI